MIYLKKYEEIENKETRFKIGDLVYHIKKYKNPISANTYNKYLEYIENNIGKIIYIDDNDVNIAYENIPGIIKPFFIQYKFDDDGSYYIDSNVYDLLLAPKEKAESFKNRKIEKDAKKYNL